MLFLNGVLVNSYFYQLVLVLPRATFTMALRHALFLQRHALFPPVPSDTGYPHDGRPDKDSYQHDGRADKDSYSHDRHNQYIMLSCL